MMVTRSVRHDLGDLAAVLVNEIGCRLARAEDEARKRPRLRWVPISLRRMKSPSETMPTSLPAASTTGSPLMCRCSMMFAASTMVVSGVTDDDRPGHDLMGAHGGLCWFATRSLSVFPSGAAAV